MSSSGVEGGDFIAKSIPFVNTTSPSGNQAVAFRSMGNRTALYHCSFRGYHDTLFVQHDHQFYKDCQIYGAIDFIFGDTTVMFQNCFIYVLERVAEAVITTQGRTCYSSTSGIVIHNSIITADRKSSPL
ncbi:hypothetical protein Droror1_Dr00005565 [Drosera rotundifolia]